MQAQNFFQVKSSQIEAKLGVEWSFLRNKSLGVPVNISFHPSKRGWFDMFVTLFIAFIGFALGGMLLFLQFTSSLKLDIWFLVIIVLAILWSIWKFWQIQFHLFGKIPRKRTGFYLSNNYLIQVKNKQILKVFPKESIERIEILCKKTPSANEGYNDKYIIKIHPKFEVKPYHYKLGMNNISAFDDFFAQGNIKVFYSK